MDSLNIFYWNSSGSRKNAPQGFPGLGVSLLISNVDVSEPACVKGSTMSPPPKGSPSTSVPSHSQPTSKIRRARFSDLSASTRTCSLAFDDDVLFGRLIHPYRKSYPGDVDKYWYRRFVVDYWDWSHVFLVATESATADAGSEIVTGFAHWSRIASGTRANFRAGWGLTWWDPSEC